MNFTRMLVPALLLALCLPAHAQQDPPAASITLPDGYVPAPVGSGFQDGRIWRETDHAGNKVTKLVVSVGETSASNHAGDGRMEGSVADGRTFRGMSLQGHNTKVRDSEGNVWNVHLLSVKETWTDAHGNVTTCRYEVHIKRCNFPADIKVAASEPSTETVADPAEA